MNRRESMVALAGLGLLPNTLTAQPRTRVARVGCLVFNLEAAMYLQDALRQGLRELGYVENRTVVIEYRDAKGDPARLPSLAAELIALKVDVIVAAGAAPAMAAKQASGSVPIVFAGVADQVTNGLVASLARPGGNITGTSLLAPELVGKCLELLKQMVPQSRSVAVLWQPGAFAERTQADMLKDAEDAARSLGMRLQAFEARTVKDLDAAFSGMARARVDVLSVFSGGVFFSARKQLSDLSIRHRLPTVYAWREFVDSGGLMSYGANLADIYRRAATYVDKILKGAVPAELPVEQPVRFELVVNLKTAKALTLKVPQSLLAIANEVIQ